MLYHSQTIEKFTLFTDKILIRIALFGDRQGNSALVANLMSLIGIALLVAGVIVIQKASNFPGLWALFPVGGAVLIIAAGSSSWFNRVLLMNPVAVWFGLISYPLYLWHWPILSFLRIIEGEKVSADLSAAAVLISVLLAWLTYRFVENAVRKVGKADESKIISLLLISMIFTGLAGCLVYSGIIYRYKTEISTVDVGQAIHFCDQLIPDWNQENDNKCKLQKPDGNTIALIGDSHAGQLFEALAENYQGTNEGVMVFPASCQSPLIDVSSAYTDEDENIRQMREKGYIFIKKAYDFILNDNNVKTVILAHNPYCSGLVRDTENPDDRDPSSILKAGFDRTVKTLEEHGKNVVIALDNPSLHFDPKKCISRRFDRREDEECRISEQTHRQNALVKTYEDAARSATKKYPNVQIVDLADSLCSNDICDVTRAGNLLYEDENHLSLAGARVVVPELEKAIAQGEAKQ